MGEADFLLEQGTARTGAGRRAVTLYRCSAELSPFFLSLWIQVLDIAAFYLKPNSKMPLISFTVFDEVEVFTRYPYELGDDPKFMAIRSPQVAELFLGYFVKLWNDATMVTTQEDYQKLEDAFEEQEQRRSNQAKPRQ